MNPTFRAIRVAAVRTVFAGTSEARLYLRHRRISFLGIMLGVATLIIVMAVMNGFRKELLDKILGSTATFWFNRWNRRSRTGRT